jgi:Flp pilus assembly protein TadD
MLAQLGSTKSPIAAERTAKACCLLPLAEATVRVADDLADRALSNERRNLIQSERFYQLSKGLTEYRRAEFGRAAERMAVVFRLQERDAQADAQAYSVLAMAYHRLGKGEEARAALKKACERVGEENLSRIETGRPGEGWYNLLGTYILIREARGLIEDQPSAAQPAKSTATNGAP